jgi:hypothetical protein
MNLMDIEADVNVMSKQTMRKFDEACLTPAYAAAASSRKWRKTCSCR